MRNEKEIHIICPYGLGDTMMVCGLLRYIRNRYQRNVILEIKKTHQCIMNMYGETNYIIHNYKIDDLYLLSQKPFDIDANPILVAHPDFYKDKKEILEEFYSFKISFVDLYREFLGIDSTNELLMPLCYPAISEELKEKLTGRDIDNIILVSPEMNSYRYTNCMNKSIWNQVDRLIESGEDIVINSINPLDSPYEKYRINMSIEDCVALACSCKKVISARSGFTDLIQSKAKNLEVFYPNRRFYELFSHKKVYGEKSNIFERVVEWKTVLQSKGYKSCAIYGMGALGRELLLELGLEGFPIDFIIDKDVNVHLDNCPRFSYEDDLPDTDVIIVTIKNGGMDIVEDIKNIKHTEAWHISELI